MVVDTSALLAVLRREPEAPELLAAMEADPLILVPAASVLESTIVLHRRWRSGERVDVLIARVPLEIRPVDLDQLEWARFAYQPYGRGSHVAGLNFGDCFSYALAKVSGERLLYKGDDFRRTDVRSVL
jgi:ribonuclease VapC